MPLHRLALICPPAVDTSPVASSHSALGQLNRLTTSEQLEGDACGRRNFCVGSDEFKVHLLGFSNQAFFAVWEESAVHLQGVYGPNVEPAR